LSSFLYGMSNFIFGKFVSYELTGVETKDLEAAPPHIDWISEDRFRVFGLEFYCNYSDYSLTTSAERVVLFKPRAFVDAYIELIKRVKPKRALEFGFFQGGSALFLVAVGRLERMVGVDIEGSLPDLDKIIADSPFCKSLRLHYNTSQADDESLRSIIAAEFGAEPLDLIVDDASHFYEETKAAFETSFGYLRPGGVYVIEDWGWAHWPGEYQEKCGPWSNRVAMSNLILELTMSMASRSGAISRIDIVDPSMVWITRGYGLAHGMRFDVSNSYNARGKRLTLL
jgi:SAM-dependent methyltransferase